MAYVDRCVKAFGGIRGLSITSLWSLTWIAVHKPLVADGVVYKPWIVVYKAFAGARGSSCRSLWWHTWIVVSKPSVAYVDRRSQAFGGRWSHLQAFGGIRGLSYTRLLMAYMDRRVEAFGGIRGSLFTSLWWQIEWFTCLLGQT